jgi:transposase, IS5 family
MHRSHSNQPALPFWQQRRNKLIIPIRAAVEHPFGVMKPSYGYRRVRYFSLARNVLQLELICLAMNLCRAAVLTS